MAYRNKTYVCFDADNDISKYRMMQAWNKNERFDFNFYDAHDINNIWSESNEETIKRRLRERMDNAKVLVVLIGEKTKNLYKFVKYEIELALKAGIPIIAVNLNGKNRRDENLCPPILRNELVIHISYGPKIMKYALTSWITRHQILQRDSKKGAYHYPNSVYSGL